MVSAYEEYKALLKFSLEWIVQTYRRWLDNRMSLTASIKDFDFYFALLAGMALSFFLLRGASKNFIAIAIFVIVTIFYVTILGIHCCALKISGRMADFENRSIENGYDTIAVGVVAVVNLTCSAFHWLYGLKENITLATI